MGVGSRTDCFVFLDGEQLGKVFSQRSGVRAEAGEYTRWGAIIVEWLEDSKLTKRPHSPSNGSCFRCRPCDFEPGANVGATSTVPSVRTSCSEEPRSN